VPRHELSPFERNIRRIIAQNLKIACQGMTQNDLAVRTGIPNSTLSGYFAERSTPSPGNVQKIANALGIHKSDIDPRFGHSELANDACLQAAFGQLSDNRQLAVIRYAENQLQRQRSDNLHQP